MPRPNPRRAIGAEVNLAERIRLERERRGWSYEVTANAMTGAGCPMQGSAVHKIEKAAPRRRITVDELVAFARVFDVTVEELLRTPDAARRPALAREVLDHAPADLSTAERVVLLAVAEYAGADRDRAWTGPQADIARRAGLSANGARRVMAKLAARGLDTRVPLGADRNGAPVYAVPGQVPTFTVPRLAPPGCACPSCIGTGDQRRIATKGQTSMTEPTPIPATRTGAVEALLLCIQDVTLDDHGVPRFEVIVDENCATAVFGPRELAEQVAASPPSPPPTYEDLGLALGRARVVRRVGTPNGFRVPDPGEVEGIVDVVRQLGAARPDEPHPDEPEIVEHWRSVARWWRQVAFSLDQQRRGKGKARPISAAEGRRLIEETFSAATRGKGPTQ